MNRLYVVTRADLHPGAQLAQSCHAVSAFAALHPEAHAEWHLSAQNLVVLQVPDEAALLALLERATLGEAERSASFREPDFGDQLTAVALSGDAARMLSSLPLALREPRRAAA